MGRVAFVGAGITLVSSTLAYNTAAAGGANLHQGALAGSALSLRNSIVSNGTLTTAGVPAASRDLYQPGGATVTSLGYNVVQDPVHVHDLNATLLHLCGFDHEKLTFRFQGRDFRLTDVHGKVVRKLLD